MDLRRGEAKLSDRRGDPGDRRVDDGSRFQSDQTMCEAGVAGPSRTVMMPGARAVLGWNGMGGGRGCDPEGG